MKKLCYGEKSMTEEKQKEDGSEKVSEVENGLKSEEDKVEQLEVLTWLVRSHWRVKIFEEDEEDLPGTTLRLYRDGDEDGYTDLDGRLLQKIKDGFNPESLEITFAEPDEEIWITFRDVDVMEVTE